MKDKHKDPTISFRVSQRERAQIEAKIAASGMRKKDYFLHACIYNQVCVVGKKETIYVLVEKVEEMQKRIEALYGQVVEVNVEMMPENITELQKSYEDMLKAILSILDGAKYLWEGK